MESFKKNVAWEFTDFLESDRVVECKWVFKRKVNSENNVTYRARLVAKVFTQKAGIDYEETFAPVLRYSTLTLLIAMSVNLYLRITHLDVKTAFLNGISHENVYMRQPECFIKVGAENQVSKLKHAIYGLKQSSRIWNLGVREFLTGLGYKQTDLEPCLYLKKENGRLIIVH